MRLAVIIDETLPLGRAANAAAILGMSIGREASGCLGPDVPDASGSIHPGITNLSVPVLASDPEGLRSLRARAAADPSVRFADFTDVAQGTRTYEEYADRLARTDPSALRYLGLCLYGRDETVRDLTSELCPLGRPRRTEGA